jgi:biopolymer transport protein ExbB
MNLLSLAARGGVFMIPIVVCLWLGLAVAIERWLVLRRARRNTDRLLGSIRGVLAHGEITGALLLCDRTPGPVASILKAAIERRERPRTEIREAIESEGKAQLYHLQNRIGVLATIAGAAPLLGFLGTVTGMIRAFMQVQRLAGSVDAAALAGGIWEALVTTAAGLLVGVLALVAHNYLVGKVERLVYEMETSSARLLSVLHAGEGEL